MLKQIEGGVNIIPKQRLDVAKTVFKYLNRYFMIPMNNWGLLPWQLNPLSGYVMVLHTIGRKSGKVRITALNYAIMDGSVYCLAGFGSGTDWLANLKANPAVEVHLAGTAFKGRAEVVTESAEVRRAVIQVVHNTGFASLLVGLNPLTLTDEKILAKQGPEVVVRIRPTEIIGGPADPGGRGWIAFTLVSVAPLLWWALRHQASRKRK
jgi:deazaflavin-dependent oxidoreductase (nitroreductase family)